MAALGEKKKKRGALQAQQLPQWAFGGKQADCVWSSACHSFVKRLFWHTICRKKNTPIRQ